MNYFQKKLISSDELPEVRLMDNISLFKENLKTTGIRYEHNGVMYAEIPGYPGYEVTSEGNLISYKRKEEYVKEVIIDSHDRPTWSLMKPNGSQKALLCHRAVATAFLRPLGRRFKVTHLDGNVFNNSIDNLAILIPSRRGVTKVGKKWKAVLHTKRGSCIYFGLFEDKDEAYQAYYKGYLEYYGMPPW